MPLTDQEVEALIKEADGLRQMRALHERDWRNIQQTMIPSAPDVGQIRDVGARRTDRVYDTTGMEGVIELSSFLQSMMVNFGARWFKLKMRLLDDVREVNQWLEDVAETMTRSFNNNTSPISQAVYEMFVNYVGFGTGGLFVDEAPMTFLDEPETGFRGYFAASLPVGHFDIIESPLGISNGVARYFQASAHQLTEQFGELRLSDRMQESMKTGNEQRRHESVQIMQIVKPRLGRNRNLSDNLNMPWLSAYIDMEAKHLISESGYRFFPFMTPRWSKFSHSPWGFGPAHRALPDVLTLNAVDRDVIRGLPMSIFPPGFMLGSSDESVQKVSLVPGTVNPMPSNSNWVPYNSGVRLDIESVQIRERQDRVRRAFFLHLLQTLPDINEPGQMTATEVLQRQRLMAQIMGPALRRWLAEFLSPFIDVTFSLGLLANLFPPPPQLVVDVAAQFGGRIDVEYEGLLSKAQNLDAVQAIDDALILGGSLSQTLADPMVVRNIDVDAAFQERMRAAGVPENLIRDYDEVQAERAQQQQAQLQQLRSQGLREDAAAAGAAAPALAAVTEAVGV